MRLLRALDFRPVRGGGRHVRSPCAFSCSLLRQSDAGAYARPTDAFATRLAEVGQIWRDIMILKETVPVAADKLPLTAFRDHLRLGSGFTGDPSEDALLEEILRSALGVVESWAKRLCCAVSFGLSLTHWSEPHRQSLQIGPVETRPDLLLRDADGVETPVAPTGFIF